MPLHPNLLPDARRARHRRGRPGPRRARGGVADDVPAAGGRRGRRRGRAVRRHPRIGHLRQPRCRRDRHHGRAPRLDPSPRSGSRPGTASIRRPGTRGSSRANPSNRSSGRVSSSSASGSARRGGCSDDDPGATDAAAPDRRRRRPNPRRRTPKRPAPTPEVAAAMAELTAARTTLSGSLDELTDAAKSAVDIPAKVRRNPGKTLALAGGAGFLIAGGPQARASCGHQPGQPAPGARSVRRPAARRDRARPARLGGRQGPRGPSRPRGGLRRLPAAEGPRRAEHDTGRGVLAHVRPRRRSARHRGCEAARHAAHGSREGACPCACGSARAGGRRATEPGPGRRSSARGWCGRGDSNPHALAGTSS